VEVVVRVIKNLFVFTMPLANLSQKHVMEGVIYVFKKCCHGTAIAGNEQNTHIIIVDRKLFQFYQV